MKRAHAIGLLLFVLGGLRTSRCVAQSVAPGRFEVEVDPATFVLKGYSLHLGYQVSKSRFNLGTYAFELPGLISGTEGYKQKNHAIQAKYDYLFTGAKGWFAGVQLDFTRKKITEDETSASTEKDRLVAGARVGYRFMLGSEAKQYRGLYFSPWVGMLYNINPITTPVGGGVYAENPWLPFATVHIGWRF